MPPRALFRSDFSLSASYIYLSDSGHDLLVEILTLVISLSMSNALIHRVASQTYATRAIQHPKLTFLRSRIVVSIVNIKACSFRQSLTSSMGDQSCSFASFSPTQSSSLPRNYLRLLPRPCLARHAYSTFTPPPDSPTPEPTPEMYLQVLETTVSAPWVALEHTASDRATAEDRLKRAYSRIFQIFMYLGRPQAEEVAAQTLDVRRNTLHSYSLLMPVVSRTLRKRP